MNRYILIPEDTIRVLPPEDGVEAAVEVFCSRTVIFFDISQIQDVCLMHNVLSNRRRVDALCFTAAGAKRIACLSGNRWCSSPRTGLISRRFWPDSGHMRRKRWIFPKRQIISRSPATTTAIITDKNEKSRTS